MEGGFKGHTMTRNGWEPQCAVFMYIHSEREGDVEDVLLKNNL